MTLNTTSIRPAWRARNYARRHAQTTWRPRERAADIMRERIARASIGFAGGLR